MPTSIKPVAEDKIPRIIKFSGGRSSAMMLLTLLEENQLDPARGDAIIFNNTSAEHPATYEFTGTIKRLAEWRCDVDLITDNGLPSGARA